MSYKYLKGKGTRKTPQSEPVIGKDQVENSAGGYAFELDKWEQLERFLILGSEGGTYYVRETQLTGRNIQILAECIDEDGKRVVDMIIDISKEGRAVKNDPALFALAACAGSVDGFTRSYALRNLNEVARIFTHLAHFVEYVQQFRGWGRALREAVSNWYLKKDHQYLAYQMVKYRQRDGWTHADMLRLAHPKPEDQLRDWLFGYAVGKKEISRGDMLTMAEKKHDPRRLIAGFEYAKTIEDVDEIIKAINVFGLTREMIPTQFLKDAGVWKALFAGGDMPTWALLRNLGNMSASGFLVDTNFEAMEQIEEAFLNQERIQKSRLHPLAILAGMKQYESGQSGYGHNSWNVAQPVVNALNEAFYLSFDNINPTGKRILLACDVSSSMSWDSPIPSISCAEATGALALVTAATEKKAIIRGFAGDFIDLRIDPAQQLTDAMRKVSDRNFGTTDCALPMIWATENDVDIDAFVVLTDSETWVGSIHPFQALQEYRNKSGIHDAKLVVVGMEANPFSIADPDDAGMLDVVGLDTSTPNVISEFIRGD